MSIDLEFPSSNMSVAFLDSSIENRKGGYINFFHKWYLYCLEVALVSFRVPIVSLFHYILHISSTVISATGWAKVVRHMDDSQASWKLLSVTSECTALLSQKSGFRGVSDSGFSLCTAPTYYFRSKYLLVSSHKFGNLIRTEHSLNRSEHRVKNKAS